MLPAIALKPPPLHVDSDHVTAVNDDLSQDQPATRLRAAVLALRAPKTAQRAPAPLSSVYGRGAAAVPDDTHPPVDPARLRARLRTAEAGALLPGTTLALVVAPTAQAAREVLVSVSQLVGPGTTVVVLGPDLPRLVEDRTRPLTVPLRGDDKLAQEWALIACGPTRRLAFLARREPGALERWCWLSTSDRVAVHRAASAILERVSFLHLRVPPLSP